MGKPILISLCWTLCPRLFVLVFPHTCKPLQREGRDLSRPFVCNNEHANWTFRNLLILITIITCTFFNHSGVYCSFVLGLECVDAYSQPTWVLCPLNVTCLVLSWRALQRTHCIPQKRILFYLLPGQSQLNNGHCTNAYIAAQSSNSCSRPGECEQNKANKYCVINFIQLIQIFNVNGWMKQLQ